MNKYDELKNNILQNKELMEVYNKIQELKPNIKSGDHSVLKEYKKLVDVFYTSKE
jgi:hypothetical protein